MGQQFVRIFAIASLLLYGGCHLTDEDFSALRETKAKPTEKESFVVGEDVKTRTETGEPYLFYVAIGELTGIDAGQTYTAEFSRLDSSIDDSKEFEQDKDGGFFFQVTEPGYFSLVGDDGKKFSTFVPAPGVDSGAALAAAGTPDMGIRLYDWTACLGEATAVARSIDPNGNMDINLVFLYLAAALDGYDDQCSDSVPEFLGIVEAVMMELNSKIATALRNGTDSSEFAEFVDEALRTLMSPTAALRGTTPDPVKSIGKLAREFSGFASLNICDRRSELRLCQAASTCPATTLALVDPMTETVTGATGPSGDTDTGTGGWEEMYTDTGNETTTDTTYTPPTSTNTSTSGGATSSSSTGSGTSSTSTNTGTSTNTSSSTTSSNKSTVGSSTSSSTSSESAAGTSVNKTKANDLVTGKQCP